MIEKSGIDYELYCDLCQEVHPETFEDFYSAVEAKKELGYKSRRDKNGDWEDVCPLCQELEGEINNENM